MLLKRSEFNIHCSLDRKRKLKSDAVPHLNLENEKSLPKEQKTRNTQNTIRTIREDAEMAENKITEVSETSKLGFTLTSNFKASCVC